MAIVVASIDNVDFTANRIIVECTLTLSGNYGTAASFGDTIDFTAAGLNIPSQGPPLFSKDIMEVPATATATAQTGWQYSFVPGTSMANGKMQVYGTGTSSTVALNSLSAGGAYASATPAVPTTLKARFRFPNL